MSLLIQAQTSDNDDEIRECIDLVLKSAKLGLIHESVDVNYMTSYTRSWFACMKIPLIRRSEIPLLTRLLRGKRCLCRDHPRLG
jgi:hypothetical protein